MSPYFYSLTCILHNYITRGVYGIWLHGVEFMWITMDRIADEENQ